VHSGEATNTNVILLEKIAELALNNNHSLIHSLIFFVQSISCPKYEEYD
jgi:hypothetical protein